MEGKPGAQKTLQKRGDQALTIPWGIGTAGGGVNDWSESVLREDGQEGDRWG
jgi:hypothetical protein